MFLGVASRFGGVGDGGQTLSGEIERIAGKFNVADERVVQRLAKAGPCGARKSGRQDRTSNPGCAAPGSFKATDPADPITSY